MAKLGENGDTTNAIYDKLVFNKFRESLGGRVRFMVTGSAPLAKEIVNFMKIAMCCPFYEGYGQTESAAGICLTKSEDSEAGHVGGPIPCGMIKLVDIPDMNYYATDEPNPRGEVCLKGDQVFAGYFKQHDKTKEAIDSDGWLHTGDIGAILPNGALKIIDRKKNLFKLQQGEYIAPDKLEQGYGLIDLIKQVFVYGDSLQSYLVSIIVPEEVNVRKWAHSQEIEIEDFAEFIQSKEFKAEMDKRIAEIAKENKFNSLEIP